MNNSDIASIKLGSAAFTRKWWESHRSIFARGSGTGKALDLWQKHCTKRIDQMSTSDRLAAEETCNTLRDTLRLAKKKVGTKDKDTAKACDTYIDQIDEFANQLNKASVKGGGSFDGEQELVDQLLKFIPELQSTAQKCLEVEKLFDKKVAQYAKWDKELSGTKPLDTEQAKVLKKQIEEEELLISNEMKKFGKWNNVIISPWKELKGHIVARKLESAPKMREALRKANGEYDIYVDALGKGQDLGQDHLHLLRRLIDKLNGKQESTAEVVQALTKLKQQLSDPSFGCGSKITQQLASMQDVMTALVPVSQALKAKQPLSKEIRETVLDLKTKTKQTDAIAQANARATQRLKSTVEAYAKTHAKVPVCMELLVSLLKGVKKAEEDFANHQKALTQILKVIALAE